MSKEAIRPAAKYLKRTILHLPKFQSEDALQRNRLLEKDVKVLEINSFLNGIFFEKIFKKDWEDDLLMQKGGLEENNCSN